MSVGAMVVLILQITGWKPLGMWSGVCGFIICVLLYVGVSMVTRAPAEKAESFIGYLEETLPKHKFI
jgi:solute:Na+ symporter, SSS family